MTNPVDLGSLADIPDPFGSADSLPVAAPPRRPLPSATRGRVRAVRAVAFAAAVLYDVGCVAFFKPHTSARSAGALVLGVALPLAVSAAVVGAATRRGARGLGDGVGRIATLSFGAPALFALATLLLAPPDANDGAFWSRAIECMLTSAVIAAGPLVFAVLAFQRAFASAPAWRASALGIGCGALATATIGVVCPVTTAFHVVVGHGAGMIAAGILGALAVRRAAA
jgi:hypothetical protein